LAKETGDDYRRAAIKSGGSAISKTVAYVAVGADLTRYEVDIAAAALARRETVTASAMVQFACADASARHLYVASSDSAPGQGPAGTRHHLTVFQIDRADGRLTPHAAPPLALPSRPIHISTDVPSRHLLVAFNHPAGIGVYRINSDGSLCSALPVPSGIDFGIFPHEVLPTPDGRQVILVTRGHDPEPGRPEQPGALKVFDYSDGRLSAEVSIAPNGGFGFGPRNLAFHPSGAWIYVTLERQNALVTFRREAGRIAETPAFHENTLLEPNNVRGRQMVGTVEVHPLGQAVYVANRGVPVTDADGRRLFTGGENAIAVFAIEPTSGRPALVQHVDTRGIHCRTFQIDPSGRLMVCAHVVGQDTGLPTQLTVFRVGQDGQLSFARAYNVDTGGLRMWWMGLVTF
jgi:6-phosphogluconolactonase (cycloisomerase 2 family)